MQKAYEQMYSNLSFLILFSVGSLRTELNLKNISLPIRPKSVRPSGFYMNVEMILLPHKWVYYKVFHVGWIIIFPDTVKNVVQRFMQYSVNVTKFEDNIFTDDILNGKLHFSSSDFLSYPLGFS